MNGRRLTRIVTALILAILAKTADARADTITFDNYTSSTDNDLANYFNSSSTQSPSGGITGGAVPAPGGAMYNVRFNPLPGLTTSVFFKHDDVSTFPTTSGPSGLVGFNGSSSSPLLYGNSETYFWAEFYNDNGLSIWNGGDFPRGFNPIGTIAPPEFGNWLKITLSESYLGDNRFELSARLENYGMTGMEPPTLLIAGSLTVTNSAAAADPSVFAGFSGYYNVATFDNFEVVPEPAAIHVIALGGLLVGFLRIKRPLFNFLSRVVSTRREQDSFHSIENRRS